MDIIKVNKLHFKFLFVFGCYLLGFSALLLWMGLYGDDMPQLYGSYGWNHEGRPLATILYQIAGGSSYIYDVSPLFQIASIALLAISTLILAYIITGNCSYKTLLFFLPLGLFPYMSHILAYKVHSLFMALSLFLAITPFVAYRFFSAKKAFIITVLSLIAIELMFQLALNIYISITLYLFITTLVKTQDAKLALKEPLFNLLAVIVALTIHALLKVTGALQFHLPYGQGVSSLMPIKSLLALRLDDSLLGSIFFYFGRTFAFWSHSFLGFLLLLVAIAFVAMLSINFIKQAKTIPAKNKLLNTLLYLVALFAFFLSPSLIQLPMTNMAASPRHWYGMGIIIALMMYYISLNLHRPMAKKIYIAIVVYILWLFMVVNNLYGTVSRYQAQWDNEHRALLVNDLEPLMTTSGIYRVKYEGHVGYAPRNERAMSQYKFFDHMLWTGHTWSMFQNNWLKENGLNMVTIVEHDPLEIVESSNLLVNRFWYKIYLINGDYFLVKFKNQWYFGDAYSDYMSVEKLKELG